MPGKPERLKSICCGPRKMTFFATGRSRNEFKSGRGDDDPSSHGEVRVKG